LRCPLLFPRTNAVAFALSQRPCGMLIANTDNAEAPEITAYFAKDPMSIR
jgi:hypothetical protein